MEQPLREVVSTARIVSLHNARHKQKLVRPQRFLYHATPNSNVESIMEIGLQPRADNSEFDYEPSVHLAYGIDGAVGLARTLRAVLIMSGMRPAGWIEQYRILRIDRRALPDHRFWVDSDSANSCVTDMPVPPEAIASCGTVSFDGPGKRGALHLATYHPDVAPPKFLVKPFAAMSNGSRLIQSIMSILKAGGLHTRNGADN